MIIKFDNISQVAIVVRDLDKTVKYFWKELGVGPWKIWYMNPKTVNDMTLHGKPSKHSFRIAEAMVDDVSMELIEHLEGETIYKEFLEKHGEGIHHLKYIAKDPEAILEKFKKEGIGILQSGRVGKCSYYYLDTQSKLGFILEVCIGQPDRPPDRIYPSE